MDRNKRNILVLCSPHNPVGRVWREEELRKLADLCMEYNVLIVSDEIHADLIYSECKHIPVASISNNIGENSITMIAPSKTFNLAGLGAAVTIIPNDELKKSFIKTMGGITTGGNAIAYTAMKAAYSKGDRWLENQLVYLEKNREYAIDYIKKYISGIKIVKPEGTYLLWINCKGLGLTNKELEKFMVEQAGIGLDVGTWFGSGGEGFMRLNIACPRTLLKDGLYRIRKAVETLGCF